MEVIALCYVITIQYALYMDSTLDNCPACYKDRYLCLKSVRHLKTKKNITPLDSYKCACDVVSALHTVGILLLSASFL